MTQPVINMQDIENRARAMRAQALRDLVSAIATRLRGTTVSGAEAHTA